MMLRSTKAPSRSCALISLETFGGVEQLLPEDLLRGRELGLRDAGQGDARGQRQSDRGQC